MASLETALGGKFRPAHSRRLATRATSPKGGGFCSALIVVALLAGCTAPQLPAFERTLAAQDSATAALGQWCAARHLASPARISASPVHDADAQPPADLRQMLETDPGQPIGYRHVRLSCGPAVLSEAHNWYLPSRLTPAMNAMLTNSDIPFGKVAASLHFTRQPLDSRRGRAPACPAHTVPLAPGVVAPSRRKADGAGGRMLHRRKSCHALIHALQRAKLLLTLRS